MSLPALKMVTSPCSNTTRTAASACAWSSASAMVAYMAAVMEFFLSTRFSVMVVTPASVWTRMSLMGNLQIQIKRLEFKPDAADAMGLTQGGWSPSLFEVNDLVGRGQQGPVGAP